ncbi:sigma-70 family RNA polymerase sigma factor [uncultured Algimonas sp.]|uniref:RNA polymerase sigma factor n=1 Tax=uncultured Algimonas sp. TaxID=1547920 RepID=UPI00263957C6|nr:sigma-70 family RNA polymerase sigma factor [uncultured Algimonas sp.]
MEKPVVPNSPLATISSSIMGADLLKDEIFSRFQRPLSTFFAKRVSNAADIDDLVQEVFLRVLKRHESTSIHRMESYLFQSASNVLADYYRRRATRPLHAHATLQEGQLGLGCDVTPERILLGKDQLREVTAALMELPQRTRDIFVLRMFEERTSKDVARLIGVSVRSVEKHMVKAMRHVSSALGL